MAYCLETGRPYTALVQVRKDGVTATLNGRPIAEWKSGFPGAGVDPSWKLVHDGIPGLGSHESPTVFHKAELRAVTGTGRLLRPAPAVTGDGTGLRGAYYVGKHLEDAPVFTRVDPTVDFNWDIDAPDTRMPADAFSVRWLGQVLAQYTEPYTFTTVADDGVRLWVDGKLLIDDWKATGRKTENSATVNLKAGTRYSIKLEYVEFRAEALVRLMWSSPSTAKAVIPRSQLFPAP
jgi:hypothetical protein